MKPTFLGLRTTIYQVPDIDKAKAWYSKVFGVAPYFDQPFYVGFNIGGYELGLHPADNQLSGNDGGVTAYWGVENVQAAFDMMLEAGATSAEQPTAVGDEIVVATVKDPWGNRIGIIYNPHFKLS